MKFDLGLIEIVSILQWPFFSQGSSLRALYHRSLLELTLFQRITLSSDGKDKSLKILQYSLKLLLLFSSSTQKSSLKNTTSSLSLARRVTRLGRSLPSLLQLVKEESGHHFDALFFISLLNDVLDDILILHLLFPSLILGNSVWKTRVEKCSGVCWAISICADLLSGPMQHFYAKRYEEIDSLSAAKWMSDLLFCLLDLLDADRPKASALSGWVAALLAYQKLRLKQMK